MGTDKTFHLGKRTFRAEELSALILKSLKEDAEAFLGEPVCDVVLTVPTYFNAITNLRAFKIPARVITAIPY